MKLSCKLYGCMGFLSLLGLIGVFSEEKIFLSFFAFVVDFEYLFKKSDEMMEQYLNKTAAIAFYFGTITMAITTMFSYFFIFQNGSSALTLGLSLGWVTSIFVHSIMVIAFSVTEKIG